MTTENQTLQQLLAERVTVFANGDRPREIIDKAVEAMFVDVIKDAFRSYGDLGKAVQEAIKAAMPANVGDVFELTKYNSLIGESLKQRWHQAAVESTLIERATAAIDEVMSPELKLLGTRCHCTIVLRNGRRHDQGPQGEIMTTPALDALLTLLPLLARDEDRAVTGIFGSDTLDAVDAARAAIEASANSRNEEESMACKSDDDLSDEALWAGIAAGMITPAHIARPTVAEQDQINAEAAIRSIYGADDAGLRHESEAALMAKLEAAEKERDALRALVVMRFDLDYPPQFTQGHDLHELTDPVTAEHCRWFVAEIERLRTDCDALRAKIETAENDAAHQKAFAASAVRVAEGWERKCRELRAKIEAMEQQEPVGWLRLYADGSSSEDFTDLPDVFERQRPLYALPGAKGE